MFKKYFEDGGFILSELNQISEEAYDRLKERYSSRPPFVFFFNPTIQLEQITYVNAYYVGYRIERNDGKYVSIDFKF